MLTVRRAQGVVKKAMQGGDRHGGRTSDGVLEVKSTADGAEAPAEDLPFGPRKAHLPKEQGGRAVDLFPGDAVELSITVHKASGKRRADDIVLVKPTTEGLERGVVVMAKVRAHAGTRAERPV